MQSGVLLSEGPTVVTVFVPLDIRDHAGHVDGAEEGGGVSHTEGEVLGRLQDRRQAAHLHCNSHQVRPILASRRSFHDCIPQSACESDHQHKQQTACLRILGTKMQSYYKPDFPLSLGI